MQNAVVTKDLMFKLRLDEQDRARLKALGEHYSTPDATVVRMLIKEKYDAVQALKASSTFELTDLHESVLTFLRDGGAYTLNEILNWPGLSGARGVTRALNELRREGYAEKKNGKYTITTKSKALWGLK